MEWQKNVEVRFPLIEDIKMEVANKFGMIQPVNLTPKLFVLSSLLIRKEKSERFFITHYH
jgi:alkyl hydroperoxide reductase subunit AhpC